MRRNWGKKMTLDLFFDLQEVFAVIFGPILQWIMIAIAATTTGLLVVITGLGLLRRMLSSGLGNRQNF